MFTHEDRWTIVDEVIVACSGRAVAFLKGTWQEVLQKSDPASFSLAR